MRPVFQNEIIDAYNGGNEPQYQIDYDGGQLLDATLTLKNPVTQPGTPHNADTMNNLFDFDNTASMKGNTLTVDLNPDDSVTVSIADTALGTVNAECAVAIPNNGPIVAVITVYDDAGTLVLRKTTHTVTIGTNGSITEVIT